MALPERHTPAATVSTEHAAPAAEPLPPLEPMRDFGWLLTILAGAGTLLSSWILFSPNESDAMWAGYWCSAFVFASFIGVAMMRSTLPFAAGFAMTMACGVGLVLSGALHDYDQTITITMVVGGALIAVGAVCQTVRHQG